MAASVDDGTAGNGDFQGDDGGNGDSARIEAALLSEFHSQHMCQRQNLQDKDLPVSSEPATKYPERPYGGSKRRRRRARTKIEAVKVSKAQGRETAYAGAALPPENASKCCYAVLSVVLSLLR